MTCLLGMKGPPGCMALLSVFMFVIINGCASTVPSAPPYLDARSLSGTSWTATIVENDFTAGRRPTIQFREDGRTVGNTGCTIYVASGKVVDGTMRIRDLSFEPADAWPETCDSLHSAQHARFLGALKSTRHVRKQSGRILLLDVRQHLLVLLERREDPPASNGRLVSEVGRFAEDFPDLTVANGPVKGMELVDVTAALGQYFGADTGVLVTQVPADNPFELREGDVILSVNDRQPANGPHALRILRSYPPGATLDLRVLRQRELLNLRVTLSE